MIAWLLLVTAIAGWARKVDLFDAFSSGAQEGLQSAVRILPCLAATLTALRVLDASGVTSALCAALSPVLAWLGMPEGAAPLLLLRPLSGAASLAVLREVLA